MHKPRPTKKVYDIYERYPVSRDPRQSTYSSQEDAVSGEQPDSRPERQRFDGGDSFDEPAPFASLARSEPPGFDGARTLRPIQLLNSLFAERLDFLQRALEELQGAQR